MKAVEHVMVLIEINVYRVKLENLSSVIIKHALNVRMEIMIN